MTDELRVVKSFLETLKIELIRKEDSWKTALRFTNLKPGYRQSITIDLDALPGEMLSVVNGLILKAQGTENQQAAQA